MTKTCTKCLITKDVSLFYVNNKRKDKLATQCKECHIKVKIKNLPKNIIGYQFGKLKVIEKAGSHGNGTIWTCQCDCGNIKNLPRTALTSGHTNSCGCIRVGVKTKPKGIAIKNNIYGIFYQRSKKRKMQFTITADELMELVTKPCYYCNIKSSNKLLRKNETFEYNGLDRIDNKKGYTKDNVITCCKHCNALRMDVLTIEETKKVIEFLKLERQIQHSPWENFIREKREILI